jgi:hypothetical protein
MQGFSTSISGYHIPGVYEAIHIDSPIAAPAPIAPAAEPQEPIT